MDMGDVAGHCFNRIVAQSKRPLFVAITGDSGSGKSYLVSILEDKFKNAGKNYTLINHDDFLIPRKDREPMKSTYYEDGRFAGKSHWEVLENMFRLDEYQRVIKTLKSGKVATYLPYSRKSGTIVDTARTVQPTDFVFFDTSMLLDEMDFVILVDVAQENIIKRKLERDSDIRSPEAIREMHQKVQGYYWTDRGKPAKADIVIDNNDLANVKIVRP